MVRHFLDSADSKPPLLGCVREAPRTLDCGAPRRVGSERSDTEDGFQPREKEAKTAAVQRSRLDARRYDFARFEVKRAVGGIGDQPRDRE